MIFSTTKLSDFFKINYSIDRIFMQFLKLVESTQIFNNITEKTTTVIKFTTEILANININKVQKILQNLEKYYAQIEKIQKQYTIRISKNTILQIIILLSISVYIKKILEAASKNVEYSKIRVVYRNLIIVFSRARDN